MDDAQPRRCDADRRIAAFAAKEDDVSPSVWSNLHERFTNRLARHFCLAPHPIGGAGPMVSFTFDDVPESAADTGAPILEAFGGRGTFYVAGGLIGAPAGHWTGVSRQGVIDLHRAGHEIACHTFSHRRAVQLNASAMLAEIARNRAFFRELDPTIRLQNFAYPYGLATLWHKRQLRGQFRSARSILPGINSKILDLQYLRSMPLIDCHLDRDALERAFDATAQCRGWLIFYSHDVADVPSAYGCSPRLLRHALEAAGRRDMPIVSVAEALERIGA